jgi:hypothetical protein
MPPAMAYFEPLQVIRSDVVVADSDHHPSPPPLRPSLLDEKFPAAAGHHPQEGPHTYPDTSRSRRPAGVVRWDVTRRSRPLWTTAAPNRGNPVSSFVLPRPLYLTHAGM